MRDPAHGHDGSGLGNGAGKGQIQAYRHIREGREQGGKFRAGRRVAVDLGVALFETQAAGQDQGFVAGKQVHEVALEDHHALGVDGSAQFRLPLQIHDPAMADADGAGNLVGQAHDVIPDLCHGQAVGNADSFALGADLDGSAVIFAQELFLVQVGSVFAFVQGLLDYGRVDAALVLSCGKRVGFNHDFAQMRKMQRQAFLIFGHAGRIVHEFGVGVLGKASQTGFASGAVQGLGVSGDGFGSAFHGVLDMRLELENLSEPLVVHVEQLVGFVVADEQDLEGQGDRFRADGAGAQQVVVIRGVVQARLLGAQAAQQTFPGGGVVQEVVHAQDEKTAVGPMHGSGLDQ